MSALPDTGDAADRAVLVQDYLDAVIAYSAECGEESLARAHQIGRAALAQGVSIATMTGIHHAATRATCPQCPETEHRERLEQFFLETIAVYDMAQNGYRETVERLRAEIEERERVEDDLRHATFALARQRDHLDAQVRARTAEIESALDGLRAANGKLVQVNQEQAEFTYALSHDLKSPINTIAMMLDLLSTTPREADAQDWHEVLDAASSTAARMMTIIDDVLRYSRTIGDSVRMEPVDLNVICREVLADIHGDIVGTDALVEVDDLPVITADRMQMRVLLQNLISNAIKFHSQIRPPHVSVSCATCAADGTIRLSVRDNGIGIPQAFQDRIFGLFQRLHNFEDFPGSGLGLTLCQRIATNHDGQILVESREDVGSTFTVQLKGSPIGRACGTEAGGSDR